MRTHRAAAAAGLLVALVCTAASAATPGKNGKLVYLEDSSVVVRDLGTADTDAILVDAPGPEAPRWSADGRRILMTLNPEGEDEDQAVVMDADGSDLVVVTNAPDGVGPASWSPGGRIAVSFVGGVDDDREWLVVVNDDGTNATPITDPDQEAYDFYPAWSPDGNTIAFAAYHAGSNDVDIELIDPDGGNRRSFISSSAIEEWPAWSPDGRFIAYERGDGIAVKALAGGPFIPIAAEGSAPDWSPDGRWVIYHDDAGIRKRRADGSGDPVLLVAGAQEGSWQPRCNRTGDDGPDTLVGTARAELLCGFGGADVLRGEGGLDILLGGAGRDTLRGGKGNDVLLGQAGDDALHGDAGKDRCVQGPGSGSKVSCES